MAFRDDVAKLYVATFNRAPDAAGLNYWVTASGLSIEGVAQSFFDQPETQALYPTGSLNVDFVNSVYSNLFNRAAEQAGLNYWVAELDSGSISKQNFILAVMNGALDTALGQDATILANKQTVALSYVTLGDIVNISNVNNVSSDPAYAIANSIMANITAAQNSVDNALHFINATAAQLTLGAPAASLQADLLGELSTGEQSGSYIQTLGTVQFVSDTDAVGVQLSANTTYTIHAQSANGSNLNPSIVSVGDSDGTIIANMSNSDYGIGNNARLSFTPTVDGLYWITISGENSTTGDYWVGVMDAQANSNGTQDVGNAVIDQALSSSIATSFTQNVISIALQAGEEYTLTLESGNGNMLEHPKIFGVYDPNGSVLPNSSVATSGGVVSFNVAASTDGTYHVYVGDNYDDIGAYSFSYTKVQKSIPFESSARVTDNYTSRTASVDDYAASTSTTGSVTLGGSVIGNIEVASDTDWFAVDFIAGQTYTISLEGSPTNAGTLSDTYIKGIFDSAGIQISNTTDDDSGEGYNALLSYTATTSGRHYISTGGYSSNTGTYTLSVTGVADDCAASTATVGVVSVGGGSISGTIETSEDRDWIAVNLMAGERYVVDLHGGTLVNPSVYGVYDSNGNTTYNYSFDYSSAGYDDRIVITAESSGNYYIAVAGSGSIGTYTLSATHIADDYASSTATSGLVSVGGSAIGNIEYAYDTDWFGVNLNAGQEYTITMQGSGTTPYAHAFIDGIYSGSGASVYATYISNGSYTFTPTSSGTYYIAAGNSHSTDIGTYTINVSTITDDYAANTSTTGYVAINGSSSGNIATSNDTDWFGVDFVAGHRYSVSLEGTSTSAGSLSDTYIRGVYTSDGTYIAYTTDDDSGTGYNSLLSYTATTSGRHYVSAGAYSSNTGTYSVRVDDQGPIVIETPANQSTTVTATVGTNSSGTIDNASDQDWLGIQLIGGHQYTFSLYGSGSSAVSNPYIAGIYAANGSMYSGTTAGGTNSASLLFTVPTSGTYYIAASATNGSTGTYSLLATDLGVVSTVSSSDLADNTATTGSVVVDGSVNSVIDTSNDKDWFAVDLIAHNTYTVSLEGSATGAGTLADPYIRGIYNSHGVIITGTSDDDSGSGTNALLVFTPTESGRHYISAGAYSSYTGTYTLNVSSGLATSTSPDIPDSTITTNALSISAPVSSVIDTAGDSDWFMLSLIGGRRYQIDMEGSPTSQGTLSDTYIRGIYDSTGTLIAGSANDDDGTGYNSLITFEPSVTGTYYVSACGYGSNVGSYRISLSDLGENDVLASTSTSATLGIATPVVGTINTNGDQDWYAVQLSANTHYQFNMEGLDSAHGTLTDPYIRGIYTANGSTIVNTSDDDSGALRDAQVLYTPTTSGTYYVAAGAYGSNTGTYSLSMSTTTNTGAVTVIDIAADISTTGRVNVGSSVTGIINSSGDQDWYAVTLASGQHYDINLAGLDTGQGDLSNPYIYGIYNSSGTLISNTLNDDGGVGHNAMISYAPSSSGTYYIAAGAFSAGTGDYTLSIGQTSSTIPTTPVSVQSQGTWNIMVYVAADNNLERFGIADLNEMESIALPAGVNVSVLVDRSPVYDSSNGNWTDTRRGLISHDSNQSNISSALQSVGELNTGDPETLTNFINWSAQTAPADHYALVIWDHGGGLRGAAWDDTNNDHLTYSEISSAITNSSVNYFDMIGFDACLMGVVDEAYALRNSTGIMVASEETEPGDGWDYASWLSIFNENSSVSATQLATQLVETYGEYYNNHGNNRDITLSAIDTTQINALTSALSNFSTAFSSTGSAGVHALEAARVSATNFYYADYVDLYSMMQNLAAQSSVPASLQTAAQGVMAAVDNAVIAYVGDSSNSIGNTVGISGSYGLSYYMPQETDSSYTSNVYALLQGNNWQSVYESLWA